MKKGYSLDVIRRLEKEGAAAEPLRPFRRTRYEPGDEIAATITGVSPANRARARLKIEMFAGGGFAGQVYRVKLVEIEAEGGPLAGLEPGGAYALKILVPPSRFSRFFRNFTYWLAFQGPFSAQVNRDASRAGVLWQKFIRRGAKVRLGREDAVADTYATFFVPELNSFAEINEWVPGRTWLYEIDDDVFARRRFDPARSDGVPKGASSREYLGKRVFMHRLVALFHEMGAPELARQYEWWTAKSQPNALKRLEGRTVDDSGRTGAGGGSAAEGGRTGAGGGSAAEGPMDGLCAIDFRAGLALLPFVPMSPGDFKLMAQGFERGSAVQFDRGDLDVLESFVDAHAADFKDLRPALEELKEADGRYRSSLPDITHHGVRVFLDDALRPKIAAGLVEGYSRAGLVDEEHAGRLRSSSLAFLFFYLAGVLPIAGTLLRRLWGNTRYRAHIGLMLRSLSHARVSIRARMAETLIAWHRAGRVGPGRALALLDHPLLFWLQRFTIGFLPAKWHRSIAEPSFLWGIVRDGVVFAWRFYRDSALREAWLAEQVRAGREEGMLTADEEKEVLDTIKDPYIKKYLLCLALHICTLPVTQVVSIFVAVWVMIVYGRTWAESVGYALAVLGIFQVTPISPGSISRGLIVVFFMVKERNWRNYRVAAMISFWKYIGYLGFPIQMVHEYPILARLMAGRWSASMVRIVPVFGEKGALLEHWVFDLFFNVPVTLARRMREKKARAAALAAGAGHSGVEPAGGSRDEPPPAGAEKDAPVCSRGKILSGK